MVGERGVGHRSLSGEGQVLTVARTVRGGERSRSGFGRCGVEEGREQNKAGGG